MVRFVLSLVFVGLVLVDGFLCGHWSGRWQPPQEQSSAAVFERVPLTVGDWKGEPQQLDPAVVTRAGFSGYMLRRYENQRTHVAVQVLVAAGRPGPLSVHTPEVCYGASGYVMDGAPTRCVPDLAEAAAPAEFWKATFVRKSSTAVGQLRVVWAWECNGRWIAADNPRWQFAGTPVLYKMYVTQELLSPEASAEEDATLDFVAEFLPTFDRALTGGT